MNKCKNCYHAGACGNYPNTGLPPKMRQELLDKGCANFKDKSLIVELPCRVGDMVYTVIDEFEEFGGPYINAEIISEISTAGRFWTGDCCYNKYEIGKTVFLSREEAERALEESEKNG